MLTSLLAAASCKLDSSWKPNLAAKRTALSTLKGSVKLQGGVSFWRLTEQAWCWPDQVAYHPETSSLAAVVSE